MYPIWVEEYIKSLAVSKMLLEISNRQAFILLDNSFEQYMFLYMVNIKNKKIDNHPGLLSAYSDINAIEEGDRRRIRDYHKVRNDFYHRSNSYEISVDRYDEYFDLVKKYSLFENDTIVDQVDDVVDSIMSKRNENVYRYMIEKKKMPRNSVEIQLKDAIIDEFNLRGNYYLKGFLLSEYPGVNQTNREEIISTLNGYIKSFDDDVYLLEVIESNSENAFHSFFIGRENNATWKCFINSFWSKYGKGKCRDLEWINQFAKDNEDRVIHRCTWFPQNRMNELFDETTD